ncbi:ATP-binding protein [Paraburkholderia sacchari]|uniref:AAA family ATPase n=2 Tax=Paraburkholderia sacchari TaxID=159450 RepID=A0A8T6ZJC7_9BURK|nr:winged helix-turn-helix domain-containing protein [Paraburkholderia sacchari]NLP64828.1 AAA family ATPase [Paraburkholderia sacchari]
MIRIAEYEIDLDMRELRKNGAPQPLGARAFDVLATLVRAGGEIVTKEALKRGVWPARVVEENNLHVQLSSLRRALGDARACIVTVDGRGYRFVHSEAARRRLPSAPIATPPYPSFEAPLIGRHAEIEAALAALRGAQTLTITGPAGIGKTALALTLAHRLGIVAAFDTCFVELSMLKCEQELHAAIANQCGAGIDEGAPEGTTPIERIRRALARRRSLLVLDTAEHLIDEVGAFVARIVADNPLVRVLVTSRERLYGTYERVMRLAGLEVPSSAASVEQALDTAAVQLFLARAQSVDKAIRIEKCLVHHAAEICRRLDGNPLEIELAAARAPLFGVVELNRRLDERMDLLTSGYRTALPRHRTLRANLDWSYHLLSAPTRRLFHRLAVFNNAFTLDAVRAVACDETLKDACAMAGISELAAKSMITVECESPLVTYRLGQTLRTYALERLRSDDDATTLAQRNARYLASLAHGEAYSRSG